MHKYFLRIAAALAALAIVGCSEDDPTKNGDDNSEVEEPDREEVVDLTDPKGENYVPGKVAKITEPRVAELTNSQVDFGVKVFDQVAKPGENTVFSPLSLYMAMGALVNGANDETLAEILGALGAQSREEAVALCNRQLAEMTNPAVTAMFPNSLKIANSLWVNSGAHVFPSYTAECEKWLGSEVAGVDLASQEGIDAINAWISDHTNGLIKEMLKEPYPASTKLAIANALYLNSPWSLPFNKELTTSEDFTNADGTKSKVEMMHQDIEKTSFFTAEGLTAVNMSLSDCWGFNMYFLLPDNVATDPADLIDARTLGALISGKDFRACDLKLSLPKFKTEWREENLKDALEAIGIRKAFSGTADFKLITPYPLFVSSIIQQATIGIDERGVEAAAATVNGSFGSNIGGESAERPIIVFNANRPFAYVITEASTNTVLFIGTLSRF